MGAATSRDGGEGDNSKDAERDATSLGVLPLLHSCFSKLVPSHSSSIPLPALQQCFSMNWTCTSSRGGPEFLERFRGILYHMPASIVDTLFVAQDGGGGVTWVEFVRGYVRCCGRMPASSLINIFFRVLALSADRAGCPVNLHFESQDADSKTSGSLSPPELGLLLYLAWIISWDSSNAPESEVVSLPDLDHLLFSAVASCAHNTTDVAFVWDSDAFSLDHQLTTANIYMWVLRTVPKLADCFSNFVNSRLKKAAAGAPTPLSGAGASCTMPEITPPVKTSESHLLTRGRAWGLFLAERSNLSEEILRMCFPCNTDVIEEKLLYRSGVHGKGMNRFWANVEGYHGPVLVLISVSSGESSENSHKWIIGALTHQGFENKDVFYANEGCLYSISPVFQVFSATGKEQNYIYSHMHPAGKAYDPHPKPVGIAFGGSTGNERVFVDEDFAKITVRHHAVDKTYQKGPLFPNQGYLAVEAAVLDLEVWGLGGKTAKEVQTSYIKREELFTEQRRKIDLKTFANWEDSPEKMMMDMMSNPNTVRREDR